MTDRTPGAPATPVAAAPGVTNPTRESPRGILQNRERAHASQSGRPTVRRPGPRTPRNLTSRGHLKEGVCPSALTNLTEDRAGRETCTLRPDRKMNTEAVMRRPATRASGGARSNVHIFMSTSAEPSVTTRVSVRLDSIRTVQLSDGQHSTTWRFRLLLTRRSLHRPNEISVSLRRFRLTKNGGD